MTRITEQLAALERRIRAAADRAGRDPQGVRILAVSKRQPSSAIREAQQAGLSRFGENYVQEALKKIPEIAADAAPAEWHFIGAIQSNKARMIAENFDWVHTVCDARIAKRLSARRPDTLPDLQICIQLRPDGGPQRAGIDADEMPALAELIEELPRVRLRGLMIMPLPDRTEADSRAEFCRTRALLDELHARGHRSDTLSMGMSADLEAAIMEGSTLVRIGTDLFGPRT